MHLFTRQATLTPGTIPDGMAYAVEIAQYVSEKTGLEVIPWSVVYGAPLGTVSWSARVESQATMGAAQETLTADPEFLKRTTANAHRFEVSPEDNIGQILATASGSGNVSTGSFVTIVRAQCAGGKIAEGMSWGVDMMEHVAKLTGAESAIVRGIYGEFSTLIWISRFDSLDAVDAADAALSTDPTYLERLDQGGDLFLPGSASQRLIRRLG